MKELSQSTSRDIQPYTNTPGDEPARFIAPFADDDHDANVWVAGGQHVWVNTKGKSHTYHYSGSRWYGTTKQGAYMCEADAGAAGYHASKSKTEQQKQM